MGKQPPVQQVGLPAQRLAPTGSRLGARVPRSSGPCGVSTQHHAEGASGTAVQPGKGPSLTSTGDPDGGSPKRPTVGSQACAEKALARLPVAFLPTPPKRPLYKPTARGRTHGVPFNKSRFCPQKGHGRPSPPGRGHMRASKSRSSESGVSRCRCPWMRREDGLEQSWVAHGSITVLPWTQTLSNTCARSLVSRPSLQGEATPGEVSPSRPCGAARHEAGGSAVPEATV